MFKTKHSANLKYPLFENPDPLLDPFLKEDSLELVSPETDVAVSLLILFLPSIVRYPVSPDPIVRELALLPVDATSSEYTGVSECTASAVTSFCLDCSVSMPNWMTPRKCNES